MKVKYLPFNLLLFIVHYITLYVQAVSLPSPEDPGIYFSWSFFFIQYILFFCCYACSRLVILVSVAYHTQNLIVSTEVACPCSILIGHVFGFDHNLAYYFYNFKVTILETLPMSCTICVCVSQTVILHIFIVLPSSLFFPCIKPVL